MTRRIAAAAITGTVIAFGALGLAAQANAEPPPPPPAPGEPIPPGQPIIEAAPAGQPVGGDVIAPPPPVGPPMVPEISKPEVRIGQFQRSVGIPQGRLEPGQGPVRIRRDTRRPDAGRRTAAPRGRSGAPTATADSQSLNAPGSEAPPSAEMPGGGPPLPEGYYPLTGPPPPGYFDGAPPPAPERYRSPDPLAGPRTARRERRSLVAASKSVVADTVRADAPSADERNWAHVGRGAAALAAAMGIGRFAYTPILPLMTSQAAITPQVAGQLATANYVGYLAGALAATVSSRLTRSVAAWRASLRRSRRHACGNAVGKQRDWLDRAANGCRIHECGGVRHRREFDDGQSRRPLTPSAGVGIRRRRCWHRTVGCTRACAARVGVAGGLVDRPR